MDFSAKERDLTERERALSEREREMDFSAKERDLTERERSLSERERERVSTDERESGRDRERVMDSKIYKILQTLDVTSLRNENELIFDRFFPDFVSQITPLHIAIQHRSVHFAKEILRQKPQLAYVLSSQGFSPLRMASAIGSADIVGELLLLIVDVSHDRDSKGWTPVHAAAMKGHVDVLNVFNQTNPEWIRDITDRDETVLHLCVKYNDKLDALKMLIGLVGPDNQLVNRKDENGNTILHLAAMKKDMKMIRYLISAETVVEINAVTMNGFTALDVFTVYPGNSEDNEMAKELLLKGAVRSGEMFTEKAENKFKNISMVVGTLTATLCFQAALVPPGGLWQDDSNMGNNTLDQKNHTAGTSILADKDPNLFREFQVFNHLVFYLSTLLILAGGTVGRISEVVNMLSFLTFQQRRRISDVVNMLSFLRFQQYLPVVLSFVSVMIYRCNKVHTPKGLPHDIRSNLNAWNIALLILSLIICFDFCILNFIQFRYLKWRLEVAKNRGSNADTGNQ